MTFSIRTVKEEDARSIIELLNPIIVAGKYTVMDEQLSVEDQIDFIRRFPKGGVFNVAANDDNQKIVGLQSVEPMSNPGHAFKHIGEISTFVSTEFHRKGIGQNLSLITFKEAAERGFLKLIAMIRADNNQALSFYLSQGFNTIGIAKKHAFVRGKYINEILTEKFLG